MRYAALKFLAALVAGIVVGYGLAPPLVVIALLVAAGFALVSITKGYSLCLSIFCLGLVSINLHKPFDFAPLYNVTARFEGVVDAEPRTTGYVPRFTVSLRKVTVGGQAHPLPGRVFIQTPQPLDYGDWVAFVGSIKPLNYPRNPGLFDFNVYYHRRGMAGTARVEDLTVVAKRKGSWFLQSLILPIRRYFFTTIDRYLTGEEGALLSGLILGETSEISPATKKAFALTGVMHILAVSGLNVGILASVLFLFFKVIRLKATVTISLLAVILFLYCAITQFTPSVVRAGLMAFVAFFGLLLERRVDPINSIFVAAIIILAASPFALFESSFQLSFSATLGLVLFYDKLYRLLSRIPVPHLIKKYLFAPLSVSAAAQLGATPLLLYSFSRISSLSLLANLAIVPLVAIATPLGFLIPIFNLVHPAAANLFAQATWLVLRLILKIAAFIGGLPCASIVVGKPSLPFVFFIAAATLLLFNLSKPWTKRLFAYVLLAGANFFVFAGLFQPKHLELSALDVSRSNAAVIRFPDRRILVWNTGSGSAILADFLRSRGISSVDFVVLPASKYYATTGNLEDVRIRNLIVPVADSIPHPANHTLVIDTAREFRGADYRLHFFTIDQSLGLKLYFKNISVMLLDRFVPLADSVTVLYLGQGKGIAPDSELKFDYLVVGEDRDIPAQTLAVLKKSGVKKIRTLAPGGLNIISDGSRIRLGH